MARAKGIDTVCEFLGQATGTAVAAEHGKADLVVANNVFAHVPTSSTSPAVCVRW